MSEANLSLFGRQGHAECHLKNLHTYASLRVVFFAAALPTNPTRKFYSLRQRVDEASAKISLMKQIYLLLITIKMETKTQNGAAVKNETAKQVVNAQNGTAKKQVVAHPQQSVETKPATIEKAQEVALQQQSPINLNAQTQKELPLDLRLKMVNELHRKSVQRMNLISRMGQLEAFEISLLQENDELEENPYQGCKLIIRDDQNREFVTTTPGLIRMTAQYIFIACNKKLSEIESTIVFPGI